MIIMINNYSFNSNNNNNNNNNNNSDNNNIITIIIIICDFLNYFYDINKYINPLFRFATLQSLN
jgi:hypothetical protein